jgi:hypothetical protein
VDGDASRSHLWFERPTPRAVGGLRKLGRARKVCPGLRWNLEQGDESGSLRPCLSAWEEESDRFGTNPVSVVSIGTTEGLAFLGSRAVETFGQLRPLSLHYPEARFWEVANCSDACD